MKYQPLITLQDTLFIHVSFADAYRKLTLSERGSMMLWVVISVFIFIAGSIKVSLYISTFTENITPISAIFTLDTFMNFLTFSLLVAVPLGGIGIAIRNILLLIGRGQHRIIKEYALNAGENLTIDEQLIINLIKINLSKRDP